MIFLSSFSFFLFFLVFSVFFASMSSNWISLWFCLELNMIMFLPLITFSSQVYQLENSMKYFLIQSVASLGFLLSLLLFPFKLNFSVVMVLAMLVKLGMAPFHGWFFSMMSVSSWEFIFILSSIQKFIPLMIFSHMKIFTKIFYFSILMSVLLVLMSGMGYFSARLVLTLSSINNISWVLLSLQASPLFWWVFMLIYMWLLFPVTYFLSLSKLNFSIQLFWGPLKINEKSFLVLMFFSLAGLPPLLGFFNKLMMIKLLSAQESLIMLILIIFSSLVLLYYYMNLMFYSLNYSSLYLFVMPPYKLALMKINFLLSFIMIFVLMKLFY